MSLLYFILLINIATQNCDTQEVDKCYSCGSYDLLARWPRRQEDNTLKYITNLPYIVDDSCEYMRREIPIVYCPDKCVKIVLETAKTSPLEDCDSRKLIVRDCWSRIFNVTNTSFAAGPPTDKRVHLLENIESQTTQGFVYTCSSFLCNNTHILLPQMSNILLMFTVYYFL